MSEVPPQTTELAIVGAGLAGLTAAAYAARAGMAVTVFERTSETGGRAASHREAGYTWNLGPHALYRRGAAARIFAELGVEYSGRSPSAASGAAIRDGRAYRLPGGLATLLSTRLLAASAKLEMARVLSSLGRLDPAPLAAVSVEAWLAKLVRHREVAELLSALVRLTTYTNADRLMSAGAALEQLQMALAGNVVYLDGGWRTLVDGVAGVARSAGARIVTKARVREVACGERVDGVKLDDGTFVACGAVLVAASPQVVRSVIGSRHSAAVGRPAADMLPVRAACLDVALSRQPMAGRNFALGIDRPLYLSVHSAAANLAPPGGAVIHVAKYSSPTDASESGADEAELEGLLDLMQPGWRDVLVDRRFLPSLVVANAVVRADWGGTAGRPPVEVAGAGGLFVAGDWVGERGLLADAAVASGREAAERAFRYVRLARSRAA